MSHDQAVRVLTKSDDFPEWARFMALAALRSDPVEAAQLFARLATIFQERAATIRVEHMEDAGRWPGAAYGRRSP